MPQGQCRLDRATPAPIPFRATRVAQKNHPAQPHPVSDPTFRDPCGNDPGFDAPGEVGTLKAFVDAAEASPSSNRNTGRCPETGHRTGAKPGVVLLHGMFGRPTDWAAVGRELRSDWRVMTPHLPMFDFPCGRCGLENLCDDLERRLDQEGIEGVVLAGNSLGGHIAVLTAARLPGRVEGLVLTWKLRVAGTRFRTRGSAAPQSRVAAAEGGGGFLRSRPCDGGTPRCGQ